MKKLFLILVIGIALLTVSTNIVNAAPWVVCHGTVITETHQPLAGATITLTYNGWYAISSTDGTFHLDVAGTLPSGTYTIRVTKENWSTRTKTFYYDSTNPAGTDVGTLMLYQL